MSSRPRAAVIFGGQSSEHEISCLSAGSVLAVIDRDRFDVVAVGITRDGRWVLADTDPARYRLHEGKLPSVDPTWPALALEFNGGSAALRTESERMTIDVAFPLLHGAYGEDGTIQGVLEMAGFAYVGSGVIASAMAMDKIVMNEVLQGAGLPSSPWVASTSAGDDLAALVTDLTFPLFVKPSRAGSSKGISKVTDIDGLVTAVREAREHDPRVIIEQGVIAREIECAVLESVDGVLLTSRPAEIVILGEHEFYDFEAKYLDEATRLDVPADIPATISDRVRELAIASFVALQCEGLARVDFFLTDDGQILVNEVNTMPGFTPTSMYPLMWQAEGVTYKDLVARLIDRAIARPRTVLR